MTIIKRIIMWIINFFKKLFGKKSKKNSKVTKNNKTNNSSYNSTSLPGYMMIDESGKLVLINNIQCAKKKLKDNSHMKREIATIIALLSNVGINTALIEESLNKEGLDKLSDKKLDVLLTECDTTTRQNVHKIIDDYKKNVGVIEETISNLDSIEGYVKKHDISFDTSSLINSELTDIIADDIIDKPISFDKDILNKIKNWDKKIVDEVKLEYDKVNYVTISTVMIDKIIDKYKKIEDDYRHHRFNKSYYEHELGKIKEQIDYLKKIKNSSVVYKEIERLRKELYTKSKDKYDILYNNEIFMDINSKCDELLNKVNQKVIDIKREDKVKEEKENKKEKLKEEYLEKIIRRFKDLNLSRELILLHQEKETVVENYDDLSMYLNNAYLEFVNGVSDDFNYQRNKAKTELVKLYNDLNNILSYKRKEKHLPIEHINFKMEDLINAVKKRKEEAELELNDSKKLSYSELVDEKINQFEEKFLGISHEKVLKKTN